MKTELHEENKIRELQGKTDKYKLVGGNFNTYISITDRTRLEKISKDGKDLANTVNQLELTGINKTLHSIRA